MTTSEGKSGSMLASSNANVFTKNKKARKIPWLPVWTLIINVAIFIIGIVFLIISYESDECQFPTAILVIYLAVFLVNIFFGFCYHFRYTRGIPKSERKRNVILLLFLVFLAFSIALFVISELVPKSYSCSNSNFKKVIRAVGILDLIFLGGFLFFVIVTWLSYRGSIQNDQSNPSQSKDGEAVFNHYDKRSNYSTHDKSENYPNPPPLPERNHGALPPFP
ncbi:hypothetical protein DLAC_04272 [Tieghemostelium lacteum]|uniref:Uncharacterized protein n=1 Tax=Tieghemostelium lacteum TaxID=361077 RepID=A0A151ZSN9_TIELA|nr:hypothetical protein DLAC_04272 [Tieghemostelium lacteum]|eukprot:KYQ96950.1 hypothetical protein DLAC_04272 [Tieghemostelium lacteum]